MPSVDFSDQVGWFPKRFTLSKEALATTSFLREQLAALKVATRAGKGWMRPVLAVIEARIAAMRFCEGFVRRVAASLCCQCRSNE